MICLLKHLEYNFRMKLKKELYGLIRFLIDSEGLGDTPNKQKCILCVQMHCLPSCEYRIDGKLEFRKNKANKRRRGIKLYIELALKRLKRFSNIKPFSSVSFYFTTFNGIWCSQEQWNFLKKYGGNGQKFSIWGT